MTDRSKRDAARNCAIETRTCTAHDTTRALKSRPNRHQPSLAQRTGVRRWWLRSWAFGVLLGTAIIRDGQAVHTICTRRLICHLAPRKNRRSAVFGSDRATASRSATKSQSRPRYSTLQILQPMEQMRGMIERRHRHSIEDAIVRQAAQARTCLTCDAIADRVVSQSAPSDLQRRAISSIAQAAAGRP